MSVQDFYSRGGDDDMTASWNSFGRKAPSVRRAPLTPPVSDQCFMDDFKEVRHNPWLHVKSLETRLADLREYSAKQEKTIVELRSELDYLGLRVSTKAYRVNEPLPRHNAFADYRPATGCKICNLPNCMFVNSSYTLGDLID